MGSETLPFSLWDPKWEFEVELPIGDMATYSEVCPKPALEFLSKLPLLPQMDGVVTVLSQGLYERRVVFSTTLYGPDQRSPWHVFSVTVCLKPDDLYYIETSDFKKDELLLEEFPMLASGFETLELAIACANLMFTDRPPEFDD